MSRISTHLKEVNRIETITLIDNYVDALLPSTDVATRPPKAKNGDIPSDTLLAEHGLSLLVTLYREENKHTILFDTGYNQIGVPHNMDKLGIDLKEIEAIVLSHGHMDHTGSLYQVLDKIARPIPLVLHPDAFLYPRYLGLDDGSKLLFPQTLVREELESRNIEIIENREPTFLADDMLMVTGEIKRITEFEKGLPNALIEKNGNIEADSIFDDQSLVINLKDRGLVVISGCSHAGIINTILFAKEVTGIQKIHAVLGGFHLSGPFFEPIIEETIEELKKIDPKVLIPMHCTGWKAIQRFSEEFPASFTLNSVGTIITLSMSPLRKGPL